MKIGQLDNSSTMKLLTLGRCVSGIGDEQVNARRGLKPDGYDHKKSSELDFIHLRSVEVRRDNFGHFYIQNSTNLPFLNPSGSKWIKSSLEDFL